MVKPFTLADLGALLPAAICPSSLDLHQAIAHVTTDSRALQPGDLFVALRGDRFDGHDFVAQVLAQGAIAAVVDQIPPGLEAAPLWVVPDTLAAYQALGRGWRQRFPGPVVAVTGSVGKTTTKELIAAVLGTQGAVLKTRANYNNEIGVPKTLLELTAAHQFAVVEMGMRGAGEIALLTHIAQPDIAVITNVGTAHIGRLGSEQAIADAKCELLANLRPDGIAILNHDNQRLMDTATTVWNGRVLTYGLDGGDLQGEWTAPDQLRVQGKAIAVPLPGRHNAINYLAALAVAQAVGIDWTTLGDEVPVTLPEGRSRCHSLPQDVMVLDETYNAGVESMTAALRLLADTPGQRRIAILGTMKELGERSPALHQQVGQVAQQLKLDQVLILANPEERDALIAGAGSIPCHAFETHQQVIDYLLDSVQPGDRYLLKASRAVGLDQVVNALLTQWSPSA